MKTLYRKVLCSERLPDKDDYVFVMEEGHYHLPNSCVYEKSDNLWFDRSGSIINVRWWLEEFEIEEGDIHSIVNGKSITLEAGLQATDDIMDILKGETER